MGQKAEMSDAICQYIFRDMTNGELWIDVKVNAEPHGSIGPFDTEAARQSALDDLLEMTRSLGAVDLPARLQ